MTRLDGAWCGLHHRQETCNCDHHCTDCQNVYGALRADCCTCCRAVESIPTDSFGCPSATDFTTNDGLVLLTRCDRKSGHAGKHNNRRTKSWTDAGTTWLVSPPPA